MTEDVYTFISVPERDAPYHKLFQQWLEQNRDSLNYVARTIEIGTLDVLDGILEVGLDEMETRAWQIEEES